MWVGLEGLIYQTAQSTALIVCGPSRRSLTPYEPALKRPTLSNLCFVNELTQFKPEADVIVANRMTEDWQDVTDKIYSRDL